MGLVPVTLPPPDSNPEKWAAIQMLLRDGVTPLTVVRIYSAGDPAALTDAFGVPRETVLYIEKGRRPRVALLGENGSIVGYADGWPS